MDFYSDVTAAVSQQIFKMEPQTKGYPSKNSAVSCIWLSMTLGIMKNRKLRHGKFYFISSYCILISKGINSGKFIFCHIPKGKGGSNSSRPALWFLNLPFGFYFSHENESRFILYLTCSHIHFPLSLLCCLSQLFSSWKYIRISVNSRELYSAKENVLQFDDISGISKIKAKDTDKCFVIFITKMLSVLWSLL